MPNQVLWSNKATTTLAAAITSTDTTMTVTSGGGALFPSPTTGQFFTVTLTSASNSSVVEVVYCTARSSDTFTIVRGQEGTTAQAFNAGDLVQLFLTAGALTLLPQTPVSNIWSATQTFSAGESVTGYDANGVNIRIVGGNYGALFRNDGTNLWLLLTNSGDQNGGFNSLKPLAVNLSTGAVSLDGTGVGVIAGGPLTVDGVLSVGGTSSFANPITVNGPGTSVFNTATTFNYATSFSVPISVNGPGTTEFNTVTAFNFATSFAANPTGPGVRVGTVGGYVNVNDFTASLGAANFLELPNGLILQWGTASVTAAAGGYTNTAITLPLTFPNTFIWAMATWGGTAPPLTDGCAGQPLNNSQIEVTTNSTGAATFGITWCAMGN